MAAVIRSVFSVDYKLKIHKQMSDEAKYKLMTEQLRMTNSDEDVANYIRWIIKSDSSKEYWVDTIKEELRKQYLPVIYENGYPIKAVPQSTIEGLNALMREVGKTDV